MNKNIPLTLYYTETASIQVGAIHINLWKPNFLIEQCNLTFELNLETYNIIETHNLFQIIPELLNTQNKNLFKADFPIQITATLDPEYFPRLQNKATDPEAVLKYLNELGKNQKNARLVQTDSWIALSVQQWQENEVVRYRTLWDYLDFSKLVAEEDDMIEELAIEGAINFFQDALAHQISGIETQKGNDQNLDDIISKSIEIWVEYIPAILDRDTSVSEPIAQAIANLLQGNLQSQLSEMISRGEFDLDDNLASVHLPAVSPDSRSIFSNAIAFFESENWEVEKNSDNHTIRMLFQGQHGQFMCLLKVKEELQQLIFYSFSPIKVPSQKKLDACLFFIEINYDLTIGNFDFDMNDGGFRFRTSIDVEGSQNYLILIKNIVYINLLTMDRYFPVILEMIDKNLSHKNALKLISR